MTCGKRHRGGPLVVLLVNPLIEVLVVQCRMGIVKEGLLHDLEQGELPQEGEERRPLPYALDTLFSVHVEVGEVGGVADEEAQEDDVEYHRLDHLSELFLVHRLVGSGLCERNNNSINDSM